MFRDGLDRQHKSNTEKQKAKSLVGEHLAGHPFEVACAESIEQFVSRLQSACCGYQNSSCRKHAANKGRDLSLEVLVDGQESETEQDYGDVIHQCHRDTELFHGVSSPLFSLCTLS